MFTFDEVIISPVNLQTYPDKIASTPIVINVFCGLFKMAATQIFNNKKLNAYIFGDKYVTWKIIWKNIKFSPYGKVPVTWINVDQNIVA